MSEKPKLPVVPGGSPFSILKSVDWCRRQGFAPVPLEWGTKSAIGKDWINASWTPPDDSKWRNALYGVGVRTGNGLIDSDLDAKEAVFFAERFLPESKATFGRASKPHSHRMYRLADNRQFDTLSWPDPVTKETIIELRGGATSQTVLPGNLHKDTGEEITWSHNPYPDVPVVEYETLYKATQKVALAVVIHRHIWADGYHNEPTKHLAGVFCRLEWPEEETIELIQAVMDYSGDTDKSRIPTIRATYRRFENNKKVSGAGVLRKQINNDRVVDFILEQAGNKTINLLNEYNERFAITMLNGKFRIAVPQPRSSRVVFMEKGDFLARYSTEQSGRVTEKGRPISKAEVWFTEPRRRVYDAVDFMPGVEDDNEVYNLWTGWGVQPEEGCCDAWLELLFEVVCGSNKELFRWMLHWFANIVREPAHKSATCPVLIGREGAGKSMLIHYMSKLLGPSYQVITKEDHLVGKFNAYMANCLLLHSEEAVYGGNKKHSGIIRSFITDETQMLEKKGIDAYQIANHARLIISTNQFNAASVAPGDRRYTIIDMEWRKIDQTLRDAVLDEMQNGGPAALLHFLLTMDYDPKVPRTNIKNEALASLQNINASPIDSWWYDVLTSGQLLPDYMIDLMKAEEGDLWARQVSSVGLYHAMIVHLKTQGIRTMGLNYASFNNQLLRLTGKRNFAKGQRSYPRVIDDAAPREIQGLPTRQNSILDMPDLQTCRKAFEDYMGSQMEWPEEESEFDKARRRDAVKYKPEY